MWVGRKRKGKGKEWKQAGVSDQISNVHGHFLNSSIVEGLNVSERALVIFGDHVDSDALSAKAAATSNTTQINKRYYITTTQTGCIRDPSLVELTGGYSSPCWLEDHS